MLAFLLVVTAPAHADAPLIVIDRWWGVDYAKVDYQIPVYKPAGKSEATSARRFNSVRPRDLPNWTLDDTAVNAPLDEFWRAIKLDLYGTFLGCRFGIPELIKAGGGSVINMRSNVALMGVAGRDCYTAV
jgi:NAD(P)-dependent dehydrogenase (short-subunit alcohol dehydrogenase family)